MRHLACPFCRCVHTVEDAPSQRILSCLECRQRFLVPERPSTDEDSALSESVISSASSSSENLKLRQQELEEYYSEAVELLEDYTPPVESPSVIESPTSAEDFSELIEERERNPFLKIVLGSGLGIALVLAFMQFGIGLDLPRLLDPRVEYVPSQENRLADSNTSEANASSLEKNSDSNDTAELNPSQPTTKKAAREVAKIDPRKTSLPPRPVPAGMNPAPPDKQKNLPPQAVEKQNGKPEKDQSKEARNQKPATKKEDPPVNAPQEKVLISDALLKKQMEKISICTSGKQALAMIEKLNSQYLLTSKQQQRFDNYCKVWLIRAEQDLFRLGTKWVEKSELLHAIEEAEPLIVAGEKAWDKGNVPLAKRLWIKANKINPEEIRTEFLLGIAHSLREHNDPQIARRHFRVVAARLPENVAALNNVALSELKMGNFSPAIDFWLRAARVSPQPPELVQNVGRVVRELSMGRLRMPPNVVARFQSLDQTLQKSGDLSPNQNIGWMYMEQLSNNLLEPPQELHERVETERMVDEPMEADLLLLEQGTGIVVSPGFVLVSQRILQQEQDGVLERISIVDPQDASQENLIDAESTIIFENLGLALLRADVLEAPPVSWIAELPHPEEEILVLGFPRGKFSENTLKRISGFMLEPSQENRFEYRTDPTNGTSGGLICDGKGRAVAISLWDDTPDNAVSVFFEGVSANSVCDLLKKHIPGFQIPQLKQAETVEDALSRASTSLVQVKAYFLRPMEKKPSPPVVIESSREKVTFNVQQLQWEDISCAACNGQGKFPCPHCDKGIPSALKTRPP